MLPLALGSQACVVPPGPTFPIIGIGASAGGLDALEQFFHNISPDCGIAFVLVQHLDPDDHGMFVELLQRSTSMPVLQIEDGMAVAAGQIHVIPPRQELSILHGRLFLLEPNATHGLRQPIDFFLRSLAEDQQERGIGVILSGMGSDGTLGLRAIKEKGGVTFVQNPAQARFDGMPRSAVEAGQADCVAAAGELPACLTAYLRNLPDKATQADRPDSIAMERSSIDKVVLLLRSHTGHDFSLYKRNTINRRIERRMGLHQLTSQADYVRYLRENPQEVDLLFKELLIGVTRFFRDQELWQQLKSEVIPTLLSCHSDKAVLRAWIAGCSTGEEAYSLAIVFREALSEMQPAAHCALQIFATDLDQAAIERARAGVYPAEISADVSPERLQRFFVPKENGYRISTEIREMVVFAPHNLVMDPPFTKLELLSCRNLLIYLEPELQKKLLRLFHYSLRPGGFLVLGSAETVGDAVELFSVLPGRNRLFRRAARQSSIGLTSLPSIATGSRLSNNEKMTLPSTPFSAPNLQMLIDAILLQHYCPAAVLTSEKGDIVYISGKTGRYLEPAAGKANLNIFAMAREGLGGELGAAFAKAARDRTAVRVRSLAVGNDGGHQHVDLTVQPLAEPEALKDMMLVVFSEAFPPDQLRTEDRIADTAEHRSRLNTIAEELKRCQDELHFTRAQMQSSQEELRSANEELQSINEELTTSKEEMQSMNEELRTVNDELQAKVEKLSRVSDDMNNLLNSTHIATLFLDEELKVRSFTNQTSSIIKLIPGDAGRPVTDLVTELQYPELADDVREVLRTLVFHEGQVPARDGRWFNVRITPYRTQDNRIDGVVITFFDISASKVLEDTMHKALTALQGCFAQQNEALGSTHQLENALMHAQAILENGLDDK